jgi:hypothetical protein
MEYEPGEGEDRTIVEVLGALERAGYVGQFVPRDGAEVECLQCHRRWPADKTALRELRRLEGASDPADMVAVVGLQCPLCSHLGTAVLSYGPEASDVDTEVLIQLEDDRRQ